MALKAASTSAISFIHAPCILLSVAISLLLLFFHPTSSADVVAFSACTMPVSGIRLLFWVVPCNDQKQNTQKCNSKNKIIWRRWRKLVEIGWQKLVRSLYNINTPQRVHGNCEIFPNYRREAAQYTFNRCCEMVLLHFYFFLLPRIGRQFEKLSNSDLMKEPIKKI